MSLHKTAGAVAAALTLSAGLWSSIADACPGDAPMLASVCIFAGNFAPRGYAYTNGQLLPISQNTALFSLLGTTYGGNGTTTFALPDTRSRVIVGAGQGPGLKNYPLGLSGGTETVTLTVSNLPAHTHSATTTVTVRAQSGSATTPTTPAGNSFAAGTSRNNVYSTTAPDVSMNAGSAQASTTIGSTGGNLPVSIVQPYVTLNYLIATQGIFPSRQ